MKKIMLTTLLALMSSQSFAANLTTQGNATTTMTLHAPAAWSITKGVEGEGTLGEGNKYTNDAILNQSPTLIIKNNSATAGTYYLRGQGSSLADDGTIMYVQREDSTKKFAVSTRHFETHSGTAWDAADNAFKSNSPLAANSEKSIVLVPADGSTINPGTYDVSVELLTETP